MKLNDYMERAMKEMCGADHGKKKKKKKEMEEEVLKEDIIRDVDGLFNSYESLIQKLSKVDKRKAKTVTDAWKKFITIVNTTVREAEYRSKGLTFGKHLR